MNDPSLPPNIVAPQLILIEELRKRGYSSRFIFENNKMVCDESHKAYTPITLRVEAVHRFEGPSSPDDLEIIYAFSADDGTKGVFVDAYGPKANFEAAEFVSRIPASRTQTHG